MGKENFGIHPFNSGFVKIVSIILCIGGVFRWVSSFIEPNFVNLIFKSLAIFVLYGTLVYVVKVSKVVNAFLEKQWQQIKK